MATFASNTIEGIINDAMHDAGLLGEGEVPNSQQFADCGRRLQDMIQLWMTQGVKLFLNSEINFPIQAGVNLYTLGPSGTVITPRVTQVLEANVVTPQGIRRPLVSLAWEEWMRLSQIEGIQSTISSYFNDKQVAYSRFFVWNTPDATEGLNTLQLHVRHAVEDIQNLNERSQFPAEWRIALRWGLADEICTGQPNAIMQRCAARASAYREALEGWDVEDSPTTWAMDSRGDYSSRGFA